jgi:DNA invertase Pin-like site-specific DNA recombinase
MCFYGYALASTLDHDLAIQGATLKAASREVIRAEKADGIRRDGRSELQVLLDFLRGRDTLVVTRINRLARSIKGARISCTSARPRPSRLSDGATGRYRHRTRTRHAWRIWRIRDQSAARATARRHRPLCVYKDRKHTIDADEVRWLCHDEKLGPAAIARRLGIGRAIVYRVLGKPVTEVTNGDGNADQG